MAKRGVKISKELEEALKLEFLHQWNIGLRGRQISAQTILNGVVEDYPEWSEEQPEPQTVTRYIKPLREHLEKSDEDDILDRPWSLADSSFASGKSSEQKVYENVDPETLSALLEIQKRLQLGEYQGSHAGSGSYDYWTSEKEPRITKREARWFTLIFSVATDIDLEDCWEATKDYSRREQLNSLIGEESDSLDLDVALAYLRLETSEEERDFTHELGLLPRAPHILSPFDRKKSVKNEATGSRDELLDLGITFTSGYIDWEPVNSAIELIELTEYFSDEVQIEGSEIYLDVGSFPGMGFDSEDPIIDPDRIEESLEIGTMWVPDIDRPYEEKCTGSEEEGDYILNKRLLTIATHQIPPKGIKESRRRRDSNTRKKAERYIQHAKKVCQHKLTCNKRDCAYFRRLLNIQMFPGG